MNEPLENIFITQITSLRGFAFQDFITRLYLLKYGNDNFLPPRKVKDKGSDGIILPEKKVVACYAPNEYNLAEFFKKAKGDYKSFSDNLKNTYPNWMFVYNKEVPTEAILKIHNELDANAPVLGIDNIIGIINELSGANKREIGSYLRIPSEMFSKDYISEILTDLLKATEFVNENIKYEGKIYTPDKIKLNCQEEDVETILADYDLFLENGDFNSIEGILKGYQDEEQNRIKFRIVNDFNNKTSGSFKQRMMNLSSLYLDKYSNENDDDYKYFINAILIYFFEQCLIGKKTESEK
jgi:hypothetical protein